MKNPRLDPVDAVRRVLQDHALGLGLTVAEIRRLYPRKEVRRVAVLEALAQLEEHGAIQWRGDRVRWVGPLSPDARPMGLDMRRIQRDLDSTPQERVERWTALRRTIRSRP